jgi:hypothetical protein
MEGGGVRGEEGNGPRREPGVFGDVSKSHGKTPRFCERTERFERLCLGIESLVNLAICCRDPRFCRVGQLCQRACVADAGVLSRRTYVAKTRFWRHNSPVWGGADCGFAFACLKLRSREFCREVLSSVESMRLSAWHRPPSGWTLCETAAVRRGLEW